MTAIRLQIARLATGLAMACLHVSPTAAGPCAKAEFEAVVSETATALRDLNQRNKPAFQTSLRELKERRGWSHDQFLKEAAPLVQDARIAEYDERSAQVLERIHAIGAEGAAAPEPSCAALEEVRGHMRDLLTVQTEKWSYMFAKVAQELAR